MRTSSKAKKLALFASGTGSNVRRLYDHFQTRQDVKIAVLVCNRPDAPVVEFARQNQIPVRLVDKTEWQSPDDFIAGLQGLQIDLIVLAGFLWKIPGALIAAFPDRILNLHPALLPKYGGKGMYGMHVHDAVIQAGEPESGITIHLVNEQYDEGRILFQAHCPVWPEDTAEDLARRIHELEHQHLPLIVERYLLNIS